MNRRQLLGASLFGIAATATEGPPPSLPDASLRGTNPDLYWKRIRDEQFYLPEWRVFLNNGSLGVASRPVVEEVGAYLERDASRAPDDYPRWGYETLDDERAEMAEFLGCQRDELAFTHCATESMSMIAAGIDLKAGDEVLITNEEHPSGKSPWHRRAQRDGVVVREVVIPHPPKSAGQLADLVVSAIGPRTRVLSFSGILTGTGVVMPVRDICAAAREKGVISVVDGAHVNGQIEARLSDMNCDYYAGSPHKWMFTPAGCGILYIREENLDRLWPTITTGGWDDKSLKAARFMKVGTNNKAIMVGMMAGLHFLKSLGAASVYERIHQMAKMAYKMASERPYIEFFSAENDSLYGGLVTIGFRGKDVMPFYEKCRQKKIWTIGSARLRISTHIHTRPSDLEAFFSTADEVFAAKKG
jgi:isopenicillin-N epimerase